MLQLPKCRFRWCAAGMFAAMAWKYYKLPLTRGRYFYVRIDEDQYIAETRDEDEPERERIDAYFAEVTYNGQGSPCSEAEALPPGSA